VEGGAGGGVGIARHADGRAICEVKEGPAGVKRCVFFFYMLESLLLINCWSGVHIYVCFELLSLL
jgi:hypothetical protein